LANAVWYKILFQLKKIIFNIKAPAIARGFLFINLLIILLKELKLQEDVLAVIWDYDGTLVDTRLKNFNVTKRILKQIAGEEISSSPLLQSLDEYSLAHLKTSNWREFYKNNFGFSEQQIDEVGSMWTKYQLDDESPVQFIDGVEKVIIKLERYSQGIVSQNSRDQIIRSLDQSGVSSYIKCIIGYEEVDIKRQKPNPDGLLLCIRKLAQENSGIVIYIGDHETDVICVANANKILKENNSKIKILCIRAYYGSNIDNGSRGKAPDYEARTPESILDVIKNFAE
jgi:HAD superfamily hydrolase (TIGR01549 family)